MRVAGLFCRQCAKRAWAELSNRAEWLGALGTRPATAIIVLLSLEMAATLLLLGAQVIAEYERIEIGEAKKPRGPMDTEGV
jgi:hypothetical protein